MSKAYLWAEEEQVLEASKSNDEPSLQNTPDKSPLIAVRDVHKTFSTATQPVHVLKGIQLHIYPGQLIMLKGRSGSGKTTLMNLLGGLDTPSQGTVHFMNEPIHTLSDKHRTELRRLKMGFIFQSSALHPLMSAWENVELSLRMAGVPASEWTARIEHCLEQVGLMKRAHHRPYELSGGEQQRVTIAKAIAHRPKLLLADEPTAELDTKMSERILRLFETMITEEGLTICMTTHDQSMLEVANNVFEMVDGKLE